MSDRLRHYVSVCVTWLRAARVWLTEQTRQIWHRVRCHYQRVPIEVLVADRRRRRILAGELRAGLRGLQRVLGMSFPDGVAVIIQHTIATDHQVAGCYQVGQQQDGVPFALVRLALHVNGRDLSTDELLATLAEQCIGIATQQNGGRSVVVPIELEPVRLTDHNPQPGLRHDPLSPHPNGRRSIATQHAE